MYDSGGNIQNITDARGGTAPHYLEDNANRLISITYTDQTISYGYDNATSGVNGIGRLTSASDASHTMAWTYDPQGRVTGKSQTVAGITKSVGYSTVSGDLTKLVAPSGQTITYAYTNHRITSITLGTSSPTTILSAVTYDPFGPATGWTWGNGSASSRSFDLNGDPKQIITGGATNAYLVDTASRITQISDSGLPSDTWNYTAYDYLDRLTAANSSAKTRGYKYDDNGNRTASTGTTSFTVSISPTSNHNVSTTAGRTYAYDAAGNTLSYASNLYTYNNRGRMASAKVSGVETDYVYNALGQLIEKSGSGVTTTLLMYDEKGHILGEYDNGGNLIQETIWMDDTPVATLRPNGSSVAIYYVHTNHLGAPIKVTRPSDNGLMWRWDSEAFGSNTSTPDQNPAGYGAFVYNLRFPGMYALPESGLFNNYFRDYDPSMGEYIESDPVGLAGGLNTYAYARSNPVSRIDPIGLESGAAMASISRVEGFVSPGPPPRRCSPVPTAPPIASLNGNLSVFESTSAFNIGADFAAARLMWTGGDWDYNTNLGSKYDDFGNFNFGAISAKMGVPYYVAQNLAGLINKNASSDGSLINWWPYGDDTAGALQIQAGYDYVAGNCGCGK